MKTKRVLLGLAITALVLVLLLVSVRAYYVVVAIFIGAAAIGHREIRSLIRTGKIPPLDERIKDNLYRSMRNGLIFFALASIFLMLVLTVNQSLRLNLMHVLGGLFIAVGAVYALSYVFYDRVGSLSLGSSKALKRFLLVMAASPVVFFLGTLLHNLISALFKVEEPVFFTIAVIIAPLALATGAIGSLVIFIRGMIIRDR